jgi:hypothetical protein
VEDDFEAIVGTFGNAGSDDSAASGGRAPAAGRKADDGDASGVLPAVTDRLKELPEALPKPRLPAASGSPSSILGIGALILLALSGLALVVYVVRFIRRPAT